MSSQSLAPHNPRALLIVKHVRKFIYESKPANLSPFLKSEKIPALLSVGKGLAPEYRPFHDFQPVPLVYQPLSTYLKSRKGLLYSGPSPIPKSQGVGVVLTPTTADNTPTYMCLQ
jgi:hypothetical protein